MHTPPNYPVIPAKFWISFLGWGDIVSKVWKLVTLCASNFSVVFPFFYNQKKGIRLFSYSLTRKEKIMTEE